MDVVKTLPPGKNGTKGFVELYGDDLVAVRYRQDAESHISYNSDISHTIFQNYLSKRPKTKSLIAVKKQGLPLGEPKKY